MAITPFFCLSLVRFQGIIRRCVQSGGGVLKWTTRADCKSAGYAFQGSNPCPATILQNALITNRFQIVFFCL